MSGDDLNPQIGLVRAIDESFCRTFSELYLDHQKKLIAEMEPEKMDTTRVDAEHAERIKKSAAADDLFFGDVPLWEEGFGSSTIWRARCLVDKLMSHPQREIDKMLAEDLWFEANVGAFQLTKIQITYEVKS